MLNNFVIVHRRKPRIFESLEAPVWATCLRSLAFVKNSAAVEALPGDEIYLGANAYKFLLEIVCGLHSPIVGETEVFGQFKIFLTEWLGQQPECAGLAQRIVSDAKALRAKHLNKLGNQSYGSWLRKNVSAGEVHILGGGQLVREVLPYLNKQGKAVTLNVRNPGKIDYHAGAVRSVEERGFTKGALIIAAPMTAAEIESWLGDRQPSQIFDLRDNSCEDRLSRDCGATGEHHGLRAIFDQIERNKVGLLPVIERVRADILEASRKFSAQAVVRPQGWDDLCA